MTDVLLAVTTFPDPEKARQIGTILIDKQLAACVTLCPGVTSIYRWQGQVETASEVMAWFKTSAEAYPELEAALRALHPYEVPEILALRPEQASAAYAQWVRAETRVG